MTGVVISGIFVGTAMATTAIGTLIPILTDAGELRTHFGSYLLAAGAAAEFLPIVLTTVLFSTKGALTNALLLLAFVALAVVAAVVAVRGSERGSDLFERGLETSGQLPVRAAVLAVFGLGALAAELGLELLLGGFVAGVITRLALRGAEVPVFESKLKAVAYGFFIPFFFVVSGVKFNLDALLSSTRGMILLPIFLGLFLIVRGVPAMTLYRDLTCATVPRSRCSPRPSSRWWWRSRPWPPTRDTCAPPPRRRWWARRSSPPRSSLLPRCGCAGAARLG